MKRVLPVVTLAASVAVADPQPNETPSAPSPEASEQVRAADPIPQEIGELRKQVDQLQRALRELNEKAEHTPQYLDQGFTGS